MACWVLATFLYGCVEKEPPAIVASGAAFDSARLRANGDLGKELQWTSCLLGYKETELRLGLDERPTVRELLKPAEEALRERVRAEWLPGGKEPFLVPIKKGGHCRTDVLFCRHRVGEMSLDLVVGEESVILGCVSSQITPVSTEGGARDSFSLWREKLCGIQNAERGGESNCRVRRKARYWIVSIDHAAVLPETWPESMELIVGEEGGWLLLSLSRWLQKANYGPVGGMSLRIGGSWFDDEHNKRTKSPKPAHK